MAKRRVRVEVHRQRLLVLNGDEVAASYPVSTAAKGAGETLDSEQTPRGLHEVYAKIGADAPEGAVFVGREPTGEICTAERFRSEPDRDWMLTRILWLQGLEPGVNRGGEVDSRQRHIYIHGTPDEQRLGTPVSHGCVRMGNADVVALFDLVESGTVVEIVDSEGGD